mgnify:CR=1 FL=1
MVLFLIEKAYDYCKESLCEFKNIGFHMNRRALMKFYTIKLPKFIGGFVKVVISVFKKDK